MGQPLIDGAWKLVGKDLLHFVTKSDNSEGETKASTYEPFWRILQS
jgi:hypothetical protein